MPHSRSAQLGIFLMAILGIPLLILMVQNWSIPVTLTFLSRPLPTVPLSLSLLGSFALGGGVGMLLLLIWRFHGRILLRKAQKQLELLNARLVEVERQRYKPDYLLPEQGHGSPLMGEPYQPEPKPQPNWQWYGGSQSEAKEEDLDEDYQEGDYPQSEREWKARDPDVDYR